MSNYNIHIWCDMDDGQSYDRTQWDNNVKDGDIFICDNGNIVGFLFKAWPVLYKGNSEILHPGNLEELSTLYPETFRILEMIKML